MWYFTSSRDPLSSWTYSVKKKGPGQEHFFLALSSLEHDGGQGKRKGSPVGEEEAEAEVVEAASCLAEGVMEPEEVDNSRGRKSSSRRNLLERRRGAWDMASAGGRRPLSLVLAPHILEILERKIVMSLLYFLLNQRIALR